MFMQSIAFVFIISAYSLQVTYAAATSKSPVKQPKALANDEDSCEHLTYCTIKPKDYPDEKFKKMFKDYKTVQQPTMIVDLNNRQGDPDDDDNCASTVTFEPLYKVRTKRDEPWRTVIQVPEKDIVQRVRLETCMNPDAACFKSLSPFEFVTFCKQKVNTWEVLVQKGDNDTETINAELPVCCSCHYKRV